MTVVDLYLDGTLTHAQRKSYTSASRKGFITSMTVDTGHSNVSLFMICACTVGYCTLRVYNLLYTMGTKRGLKFTMFGLHSHAE